MSKHKFILTLWVLITLLIVSTPLDNFFIAIYFNNAFVSLAWFIFGIYLASRLKKK